MAEPQAEHVMLAMMVPRYVTAWARSFPQR
jgi:hypothetical protein